MASGGPSVFFVAKGRVAMPTSFSYAIVNIEQKIFETGGWYGSYTR
ncbi:hypothetical protein HMPREF0083_03141 [Aneurinibacillus aneurinilyticus ATCC 12856]|uniref:Uncharacterized protein n=1 Tax=Aneurinibacillus aneurinilyticus ATCC 12856 TaxID=649747 RepID=U1WJK1_ANEAE|nr:hypothetical protein HMPREF0083_03141 [Aneurinibacillus aneurinilyticus ATCC 12856]